MNEIEKIVIATPRTTEDGDAVAAGLALARASGAAVELIDVLPLPTDLLPDSSRRLLLARAAEAGADLIVLDAVAGGQPGRRGPASAAERVIRKAACPVLVARPGSPPLPARVLVAVDLDSDAAEVLRRGLAIAAPDDRQPREVEALFVDARDGRELPRSTRERRRRFAEEKLRRLVGAALPRGPGARCIVRSGDPGAEILAEAAARRADLVVVGTHGRGTLERVLLGSVAARVVREARCNVLVVPAAAVAAREQALAGADWTHLPEAEASAFPPLAV